MQRRWNGGAGEWEGEMKDCRGKQKTTGNAKYHSEHNRRFMSGRLLSHGVGKKTINRTGGNVWLVSLALQTNGGSPGCIICDAVEHLKKRKEGNEFVSMKQLHVKRRNSCHNKMLNLRVYFFKWGLKESAVPGGRRKKCGVNRPPYAL